MPENMHSWHASHSLKARVVLWLAPVVYDDNRRVGLLGNCFDKINKRPTGLETRESEPLDLRYRL